MASSVDTCKGTVVWFDARRGFGFIKPEDGGEDLFVHISSIKVVGFRSLAVGDAVEFVVSVRDDGRKRAVSVTGPDGAYIKGRRYFSGVCYHCGKVGHKAMDCGELGPCYSCWVMGHLARDCPAMRVEPASSPRTNLSKPSNLGSISPHSLSMASPLDLLTEDMRTLSEQFSKNSDSEVKKEDDDEMKDEDKEIPRGVEERNWTEIPFDILWIIFEKIAALEILRSAQFVCRMWRHLSHEPYLWRHIQIKMPEEGIDMDLAKSMTLVAVERSKGCIEEFYLERLGGEILRCISDRAPKLRRLRLISINNTTEVKLAQAVRKFSLLEDLEISFCLFSSDVIRFIGHACPQLKSFRLNSSMYHFLFYGGSTENLDAKAFAIATNMQQLHRLQLIGNGLTNHGLFDILNRCPNLQYLDIRACVNVNFDKRLKQKSAMIKDLRLPQDSTDDFEFNDRINPYNLHDEEYI